jgi:DNA-binding transcriptional ArsR family regulator
LPNGCKPVTNVSDPRDVKALSHPLRVRILALLQERTASPRERADWLDATLGTVSYHVRTLHDVGLMDDAGPRRDRPPQQAAKTCERLLGELV